MIRRLEGTVISTTTNSLILDVRGVGYLIHTAESNAHFVAGETAVVYTYLAVRETALDLYGFVTEEALHIFELLLTLPKIGPKSASQILGQADLTLLKQAVRDQDATYLSKMSGIGKKSAEKIVAGLKEPFEDSGFTDEGFGVTETIGSQTYISDTIDALVSLGYPQSEARRTVQEITAHNAEYHLLSSSNKAGFTKIKWRIALD